MNTDKYFKHLITRIENPLEFNILITLSEFIEKLTVDEKETFDYSLRKIGIDKGYFEVVNKNMGWFSLSDLGMELRKSKLPYKKFEKKRNSKKFDIRWIGYLLTALTVFLGLVNRGDGNKSMNSQKSEPFYDKDSLVVEVEKKSKQLLDTLTIITK